MFIDLITHSEPFCLLILSLNKCSKRPTTHPSLEISLKSNTTFLPAAKTDTKPHKIRKAVSIKSKDQSPTNTKDHTQPQKTIQKTPQKDLQSPKFSRSEILSIHK